MDAPVSVCIDISPPSITAKSVWFNRCSTACSSVHTTIGERVIAVLTIQKQPEWCSTTHSAVSCIRWVHHLATETERHVRLCSIPPHINKSPENGDYFIEGIKYVELMMRYTKMLLFTPRSALKFGVEIRHRQNTWTLARCKCYVLYGSLDDDQGIDQTHPPWPWFKHPRTVDHRATLVLSPLICIDTVKALFKLCFYDHLDDSVQDDQSGLAIVFSCGITTLSGKRNLLSTFVSNFLLNTFVTILLLHVSVPL